jgi:hypothetical protein
MITLYFWNLGNFLSQIFTIDLINLSIWGCKFGSLFQFTSLQISAWILVLISLDQLLSVNLVHWRTVYFKPKQALIATIVLVLFFIVLNFNILILFGYEVKTENSTQTICYDHPLYPETKWMMIWGLSHLMFYSVVPFVVLAVSNFALIGNFIIKVIVKLIMF